jgi:hypothetical protein
MYKSSEDISHYHFKSLSGMDRGCLNDVEWEKPKEANSGIVFIILLGVIAWHLLSIL